VKISEGDRLTCRDLILTAKIVCLIFLAFQMEVKYKLVAVWLGIVLPKDVDCHHLLTLILFQTCMTFFVLWEHKSLLIEVTCYKMHFGKTD